MLAQYEEKWVVFNQKDIDKYFTEEQKEQLRLLQATIAEERGKEGKGINNYYVCNQDEPYADWVIQIILDGENIKLQENSKELIPEIAKRILKHAIKYASLPRIIRVIKDLHPTTFDEIRNHIHQIQNILVAEYVRYTDLKKELELY